MLWGVQALQCEAMNFEDFQLILYVSVALIYALRKLFRIVS